MSEAKTSAGPVGAPLIGRDEELASLRRVLSHAVQYQAPQVVLISGAAGVGKTRLITHWLASVEEGAEPCRTVRCRAGQGQQGAYELFGRMLRVRLELPAAGPDLARCFRKQVEGVLGDRRLTEFLHFLGSFVGVAVPDSPFIRALDDDPQQHDQIARTVLRRFLERDAEQQPMVVVLEDLHLADSGSVSLFQDLAQSLGGVPLVLVASCRQEIFERWPDLPRMDAELTALELGPLDLLQSEELLRALLRRVDELPDDLVRSAVDKTGGNPFFIEELVRLLIANGTIAVGDERWLLDDARLEEVELPISVEEAVRSRLAALSAAERSVLEKAAVLGEAFWKEALICFSRLEREVAQKSDLWLADVEHRTVQDLLERLVDRDLIQLRADSSIPGAVEYAFKRRLERELVSRTTGTSRQQQYHLFAAQWLESQLKQRSEQQLEQVGTHYVEGGDGRRAAFFYIHAGDKARARYAGEQALDYYRRGVEMLGVGDVLGKIEALHNLGDVCALLGRHQEALGAFGEMLHNAWLLDNQPKGGAAHRRIGRIHRTLGDYDRAMAHLQSAMRLFARSGDRRGEAATLDDVGRIAWIKGEYSRALEFHRKALSAKRELGDPRSIAVTLNNIGTVLLDSGSFNEAHLCFVEALEARRGVEDKLGVVDSLLQLGGVFRAQSHYSKAFELWDEALELATEIGDRIDEAYLLLMQGEALTQLGKTVEAQQRLERAGELARDLGDKRLRVEVDRALAGSRLATGDLAGAEREARTAYETSMALGLKREAGATLRTLAETLAAQEIDEQRKERAVALFNRAIQMFSDLGNDLELARTYASFADYHDRCGQWEDAQQLRASADEIIQRLKGASQGR